MKDTAAASNTHRIGADEIFDLVMLHRVPAIFEYGPNSRSGSDRWGRAPPYAAGPNPSSGLGVTAGDAASPVFRALHQPFRIEGGQVAVVEQMLAGHPDMPDLVSAGGVDQL